MTDRVLLTGISGFLGGHLALALLARGYSVRGSVRDLGKAEKVRATLGRHGADLGRLEFVELDLVDDRGWKQAMAGVRYLQHTASPFVTRMPRERMQLVRPAVEGTERALEAALAAGVERIVLTSSMAAIMYGHDPRRAASFTEEDWTNLEGRDVNAYIESKTRAERRAWEIVNAAGRHEALAAVNPAGILGPLLDDDPGTSAALVSRLLDGSIPLAPRIGFAIVDVRDVAALHVSAMETPAAGGSRHPIGFGPHTILELADMLRPVYPDRRLPKREAPDWIVRVAALFDAEIRGNIGELGVVRRIDSSRALSLLGRPPIPVEDAVRASAASLLAEGLA